MLGQRRCHCHLKKKVGQQITQLCSQFEASYQASSVGCAAVQCCGMPTQADGTAIKTAIGSMVLKILALLAQGSDVLIRSTSATAVSRL